MRAEFHKPVTTRDVASVALLMREADRDEIAAASGIPPLMAVRGSVAASIEAYAGRLDNRTMFVCGIAPASFLAGHVRPWLLATYEAPKYAVLFMRQQRRIVGDWQKRYRLLENYVDARNAASIKWLKLLGFQFEPAQPFGIEQRPFHRFFWCAP